MKRKLLWAWAVVAGLLAVVGGPAIALVSGSGGKRFIGAPNALRDGGGAVVHESKFSRAHGGEAGREGSSTPAQEQVADRAYPRNYVDDRLVLKEFNHFGLLPRGRSALRVPRSPLAPAAVTGPWRELGPFTPNVAAADSQFFDPTTQTGPTTQESGRVTALAIDPACAPGNCRMWVASAGGGIWRTNDALASHVNWVPPALDLPTTAFGSLYYDAAHSVLYAGSGEPNGSGDSEAGLGLFRSTDGGVTWSLVPGSAGIATNRSIGAIAVDPTDPTGNTVYIGTDVARHGSSSVNGGRKTPPGAPPLGVYKSIDGGASFTLEADLSAHTPPNPSPASSGVDWFQGGITKLEFDPNNPNELYAGVFGYGVWRSNQSSGTPAWEQVFHTMNQNNFSNPSNPKGDSTGDRTEFDLVNGPKPGQTRAYLGDASDDFALAGGPYLPEAWRVDAINTKSASTLVNPRGTTPQTMNPGWTLLSNPTNGTRGFAAYGWCQNGQCGYDSFVAHPSGASPNTVWFGGSMNYNELPAYDQFGAGAPPRSNGRAVIRTTNGGSGTQANANNTVTWQDMTAVLADPSKAWGVANGMGIHPDLHAIAFAQNGNTAFIGSDGGVVRIDVSSTRNQSASCAQRKWDYGPTPHSPPTPLRPLDLLDCQRLLGAVPHSIAPVNDGLRTLQFQSLSFNPANPTRDLLGGTQDNGTWSYAGSPSWLETVGGDGGQSGFNAGNPTIRFHNYFDATPEVNFHGVNPTQWLDIYDPLQITSESRSFFIPFTTDPVTAGRAFAGLQHVWRTDDNGGNEAALAANGCYATNLNPFRTSPCGDWVPIGQDLTSTSYGSDRAGQYVVAAVRAATDAGTMWAGTRTGRVFVASNANDSAPNVNFYRVDSPNTPGRFVSGIAIDPGNADHAWISYSGYNAYTPTTPGHVFDVRYHPTTHTATFTDISHNLGDQPVTGIAEDQVTGTVFAATDFGVAELPAGSSTWVQAGRGLPTSAVYGLTVSQSARVLYAATHGRGAWSLALPPAPPKVPTGAIQGPATLELGQPATYTATGSSPNSGPLTFAWSLPRTPSRATGTTVKFTPTMPGIRTITLKITAPGASTIVTQAVTVRDTP